MKSIFGLPGIAPIAVVSMLTIAATGCGETEPFAYEGLAQTHQLIEKSTLSKIVKEHRTRADVIGLLGEPDKTNEEVRSIGYQRCTLSDGRTVSVFFLVPVWTASVEVRDCQRAGVWFDQEARAIAWDAERDTSYGELEHAVGNSLEDWLAKPGGSRD